MSSLKTRQNLRGHLSSENQDVTLTILNFSRYKVV